MKNYIKKNTLTGYLGRISIFGDIINRSGFLLSLTIINFAIIVSKWGFCIEDYDETPKQTIKDKMGMNFYLEFIFNFINYQPIRAQFYIWIM